MSKLPKYLNKKDSNSKQGLRQEEKARKHIASGRLWFDQYDLTQLGDSENFLIDVKKVITQKGIRLEKDKIKKLFNNAIDNNKIPAYLIYIGDYVIKAIIERNPDRRVI